MNRGTAKPEKNSGKKLTLPVKTRTPLEAYQMLVAGQPIDQIGEMYHVQGKVDKDFFMMDKLEKLHKIKELRAQSENAKGDIQYYVSLYNESIAAQNVTNKTPNNEISTQTVNV